MKNNTRVMPIFFSFYNLLYDVISTLIEKVLMQNPDKVKEYQNGKKGLLGFFMGQVKQSAGLALDVGTLKSLLEEALNKSPSKN